MRYDEEPNVRDWRPDPGKAQGLSQGKIILAVGAGVLVLVVFMLVPLDWLWPRWFGSGQSVAPSAPIASGSPDLKELNGLASHHTPKPPEPPPMLVTATESTPDTSLSDGLKGQYDALKGQYDALNNRLTALLQAPAKALTPPPTPPTTKAVKVKVADPAAQQRREAAKQKREAMLSSPTGFLTRSKEEKAGQLHALKSPYSLAPSEEIPCETTMTISSETPGAFVAVVSRDVPDTATRKKNVIPLGSKFVLKPRRSTIMGDSRIDVQAQTLTFPSGPWLKLPAATMTDQYGTAGFTGPIDRHLLRNYGAVILTGVLRGGTTIMAGGYGGSTSDRVAGAVAQDTASEATRDMKQFIRSDPTITVPSTPEKRYTCRLLLEEELVLTRSYPWSR